jgi:hypothetical protein
MGYDFPVARAKKKAPKKKPPRKAKAATKKKPRAKPKVAPKKKSKAGKGKSSGPTTEVEQRWNEYWTCRKQLEETIEQVRASRAQLTEIQAVEREHRTAFEDTKRSLKQLLEVEPAAAGADNGAGSSENVFELDRDAADV